VHKLNNGAACNRSTALANALARRIACGEATREGRLSRLILSAGVALSIVLGASASSGQSGSKTPDEIYAELAKLPPAERSARILEGARREGKLAVSEITGQTGADHIAIFKARYPFVTVDLTNNLGSQDAAERLVAEETAGRHLTDVIVLALPDLEDILPRDVLAVYPTPFTSAVLPVYRGFLEPKHRWVPWYWSEHGISYNSNLVPKGKEPKSWDDLCNPVFKGSTSFDPAEIDYLAGLYAIMGEQKTEALLKCMGENNPIIQRGHTQRLELMLAGDHMVQADNYLYRGVELKRKNPAVPYEMVLTAPVMGFGGVSGINKNTQHPYTAALYVDWCLSDESQKFMASILRAPITVPHPFLPESVKIVTFTVPEADIMKRLMGYWNKYMAKRT
jgi:iron(III) transport system substrate-binding protein